MSDEAMNLRELLWRVNTDVPRTSLVGRLTSGSGPVLSDMLQLAGLVGAAGFGVVGSNAAADRYRELSDKYLNLGAPARARLEASYADPNSFLNGPDVRAITDQTANAAARALSTKYGNPFDSPNAWAEIMDQTQKSQWGQLSNYRNQLAAQARPTDQVQKAISDLDSNAVMASTKPMNIGSALLGDITTPKANVQEQMRYFASLLPKWNGRF